MNNINEGTYSIILGVVLEELAPNYWIKEEIEENIYEEIDTLKLKKLIYIIKNSVEETQGILEIHEERKLTLEELKQFTQENFEQLKVDIKNIIRDIRNK